MIDSPDIKDWRQLQESVCRLFNEVGLTAKTEVCLRTPRGAVEVDVYAVDERSVDRISYVVECKNWNCRIPQQVVHSFTNVMQETGANIGFLVSKIGFQPGAVKYTKNTNVVGLTYQELQNRYFEPWWNNHFCIKAAAAAKYVCHYTEPINSRRDNAVSTLSDHDYKIFCSIEKKYGFFSMLTWQLDIGTLAPHRRKPTPGSVEEFKSQLQMWSDNQLIFNSIYWRDLLSEMILYLHQAEKKLNQLFGKNIFLEET